MKKTNDELVDIVNEQDEIIKQMWRSQASAQKEKFRRVVLAFLKNEKGEVCFLRRATHKTIFPDHLDIVGGSVQAGETYEQAFKREVIEEVALDPDKFSWRQLGIVHPLQEKNIYFKAIFEIVVAAEHVQLIKNDFSECFWVKPEVFFSQFAQDKVSDHIEYLLTRFYLKK